MLKFCGQMLGCSYIFVTLAIGGSSQPNVYQFVSHKNITIRSHKRIITAKRISLNVAHKFPALEYKHVLSFNKAPMHVCLYTGLISFPMPRVFGEFVVCKIDQQTPAIS